MYEQVGYIAQEIQLRGVNDFQEILAMAKKLDFFRRSRPRSYGINSNWGHRSRGTNEGATIRVVAPRRPVEPRHPTELRRPAEPHSPTEPRCPARAATAASAATAATAATAAMASPNVLTFDAEGRAVDFDVWVDDLQLFLQCDSKDGVHLPSVERTHFGQYKTAKSLYDAVVARYSSPATAALSRLMLPYLFSDLAAFATVADLITHLRTSDARYRTALPTEFCAKNPSPFASRHRSQ
ncbi:unnamed protein product [Closterium sp. NIES-54]